MLDFSGKVTTDTVGFGNFYHNSQRMTEFNTELTWFAQKSQNRKQNLDFAYVLFMDSSVNNIALLG